MCNYSIKCADSSRQGFMLKKKSYQTNHHIYKVDATKEAEQKGEYSVQYKENLGNEHIQYRTLGVQTILNLDDLMTLKFNIAEGKETREGLGELVHVEKELMSPK